MDTTMMGLGPGMIRLGDVGTRWAHWGNIKVMLGLYGG